MKIVFVAGDLFNSIGGIQSFNKSFVYALSEISKETKDFQIEVVSLNDCGNSPLKSKYISSHKVNYVGYKSNKINFIMGMIRKSIGADRVIFGHVNLIPLLILLKVVNFFGESFLVVHGIDVWKKLSFSQNMGILLVNRILSVSSYTKSEMIRYNKTDESKFVIFPNTLDPFYEKRDFKVKPKRELNLPEGKMILTVSRLGVTEKKKNIDKVIEAMPMILKKVPDAFYVIVGDGGDKKRLTDITIDLGVLDKVIFVGKVEDEELRSYYANSDLFVLLSEKEGFGIVFLEAIKAQVPCLGFQAGGVVDVIEADKSGVLLNDLKINTVADAVCVMLLNKSVACKYTLAAKSLLNKKFSFDRFKSRIRANLAL